MKKNLVIDDDVVENKTLYKKVNDIKKERENEKEKDLIARRKNAIISFFLILMIIGLINFLSSISRFRNARILDEIIKQYAILGRSLLIFFTTRRSKFGNIIYKIVSKPSFRLFVLLSSLIIFLIIAYVPSESLFPTINGGKGWVHIGPVSIQVPEIFKIPFIMVLASILSRGKEKNRIYAEFNFCSILHNNIYNNYYNLFAGYGNCHTLFYDSKLYDIFIRYSK